LETEEGASGVVTTTFCWAASVTVAVVDILDNLYGQSVRDGIIR
jgi:hypothetical protein